MAIGQVAAGQAVGDEETSLATARDALAADEPTRALSLAESRLEAVPDSSEAHVVAGLALFALDRPQAALHHFYRAIALGADDPQRVVTFNRASCLLLLGDLTGAEREFLTVARGSRGLLATLAFINAGFTAVDAGAPQRAYKHLESARANEADGELLDQRRELAAAIREARRRDDAALQTTDHGDDAEPADADASDAQASDRDGPRQPVEAELFTAASLAVGYDSNPPQAGLGEQAVTTGGEAGSPFAQAYLDLGIGLELPNGWRLTPSYGLSQSLYTGEDAADWSSQDHLLDVLAAHDLTSRLRLELTTFGSLSFAGREDFRGRSIQAGVAAALAHRFSERWELQAAAQLSYTSTLTDEFDFLSGPGAKLAVTHRYSGERTRARIRMGLRHEGLGSQQLHNLPCATTATDELVEVCSFDIPLTYNAPSLSLWVRQALIGSWALIGWAEVEGRFYQDRFAISSVEGPAADFNLSIPGDIMRQRDGRLRGSAAVSVDLSERLGAQLRYELHLGDSNVDNRASADHYGNENFIRHQAVVRVTGLY